MRKKITFTIIYFCILSSLNAREPLLARLENIISNEIQRYGIDNYTFECKPYGVLTLERLYHNPKISSLCKKNIEKFYIKNPKLEQYVDRILEYKQLYHVEIKNMECIIYAKGQVSLSELLLQKGLAVKKIFFKDEEFENYFTLAQRKAKIDKKGLWDSKALVDCLKKLNK